MFVKSSRPTYKRRVKKAQEGIKFATYTPVEVNQTDYRDLTSIDNPFNEFNFATTYDKPTALVVPETTETKNEVETKSEPVVVNKPTQNVSTSTTWRSPYNDRAKWTKDLSDAYRKVGITNDNAIRMLLAQDALESGWGKSAQGKYNFGNLTTGSSWKGSYVVGNDKNAKGEAIKQKFRAYESMDDYAKDKVQFLKRLYDFDENDDINKFVAKLTGANKGKRKYAENVKYANLLTNVYNSFKDGGVIRYDGGGVAKRDAITNYRPEIPTRIRKATPAEYIKSVVNIYGQNQSQVSPDSRSKWQHEQASKQADKGYTDYMEAKKTEQGLDRLNQFLTFTDVAGLATGVGSLATKGISYAGKQATKQLAKHTVGREFKRQSKHLATPTQSMPNNVGWGPRQTIKGAIHDKDTMEPLKLYSPKRYDAINEGAPKAGVWFQGKLGVPRTAANHSIPGKAEKAANARDLFAKRPVRVEGDLELNKPLVTVGDVPNRAQIQRAADTMGGDGVIFNDVYDNGYGRNQVVFSYRTDLKNSKMFKKGSSMTSDTYTNLGNAMNSNSNVLKSSDNFIEYLNQKETIDRLKSIDNELGTTYTKGREWFLNEYNNRNVKLEVIDAWNGDNLVNPITGEKYRNRSETAPTELFLSNPTYKNIKTRIVRQDPPHAVGHEYKHGIEDYLEVINNPSMTDKMYNSQHGKGIRLEKLFDKDNINSLEEFAASYRTQYPKATDEAVNRIYGYLTQESEFSSNLHPLVEANMMQGKPGVPNFKTLEELESALNQYLVLPYENSDPMFNTKIIYNHLIKDKDRFRQVFNRYGYGIAAPAGMSVLNAKKPNK